MSKKTTRKFAASTIAATAAVAAIAPVAIAADTKEFTDVKPGDSHYEAITALTTQGVIKGYPDGTYKPWEKLSRAHAAVLFVNALGLEPLEGEELEEYLFTDVSADHQYAGYIAAARKAGIFKGLNGEFQIEKDLTREAMASTLVNAFGLDSYDNGEDVQVNLGNVSDTHKSSVQTLANLNITVETDDYRPLEIVNRGQFATFLYKSMNVEEADAAVSNVTAVNAKQILVKFNKAVGDGAFTATNYEVTTVANDITNTVTDAVVQSDGKSVLLTLQNPYRVSTDVVVTVDNVFVKGSIKETFPRFSEVITVHDTVAPSIASVSGSTNTNAAQTITVKFSEPINPANAVFKVNGSEVTAVSTDSDINDTFTISGLNLSVDKQHTLEVLNFEDYAEHKVTYASKAFSITKDSQPATGKVSLLQDNQVAVTFDKAMNLSSIDNIDVLYYNPSDEEYQPLTIANRTLASGGKVAVLTIATVEQSKLFGLNDNAEELLVKVKSGVVDALGNTVEPFEQRITTTKDSVGPALDDVTFTKNSKGEVTTLYFHFNEVLAAAPAAADFLANISVTDTLTNTAVDNSDIFGDLTNDDVKLASDGKTIIVTPNSAATNKLLAGTYNFKFAAGLVTDTSFATNGNTVSADTVNFGAASNTVVVTDIDVNEGSAVDNIVTVTFSKAVTTASAKNPANYSINGVALPSDTVIQVLSDTTVKFTIPEGFISASDDKAVIRVSGIQPQDSSSTFASYVGVEKVLDNTAPVANGTLLTDGTIQFTFTDGGSVTPNAADFVQVRLNGKLVDKDATNATTLTNKVVTLPDGTNVVTMKVEAKVAADYQSTGFTYQYVDVDGDDSLDFTKDIVLQSVAATTAPGSWTTTANLNLLDSVEVITAGTTSTKDDSAYKGTGNVLKPNNVLKVK